MTVTHIAFNDQSQHGRLLRRALQQIEDGQATLVEIIATFNTMIDGDGSDATQFTYATSKFGFADNATAKSAWDELNSVKFKITTDDTVDHVNAALLQAFNKFR